MEASRRSIRRALVATSSEPLRSAVTRILHALDTSVTAARSAHEAIALLASKPDAFLFDVRLGESPLALVDAANAARPIPLRIAMGTDLSPQEAFELARRGVSRLCALPIQEGDLRDALQEAGRDVCWAVLADAVGKHPMHDMVVRLREAMTEQALALSRGNRGAAARLLGMSRQAVHQSLRRPAPHLG